MLCWERCRLAVFVYICSSKNASALFLLLSSLEGGVYNIEPGSLKIRRRIAIGNISHISVSLLSDNFLVIHVPQEYDYLYASGRKTEIVAALRLSYSEAIGEELSLTMQNV